MPYLKKDNLNLHFTDVYKENNKDKAVITLHGLSESHLYWSLSGIADNLKQAGYRIISMDMRGHGFTEVSGDQKGYDIDTIVSDIQLLADHLELEKFHLLTHATGGIAGFRYAMHHPSRLLSIMATDTGSATYPSDAYCDVTDPDQAFPPLSNIDLKRNNALIRGFRNGKWGDVVQATRLQASKNPFLSGLDRMELKEQAFALYTACSAIGDLSSMGDFVEQFYTDYDPCIKGLREITCPVLMLLGEFDRMFIKPAQLIAREVPDCKHVLMKGVGHMTAFENPEELTRELLQFLKDINNP